MRISIFPKAKALPRNKDEKMFNSKFCSSPHSPTVITLRTEEELINVITNNAWSPSIFSSTRKNENFLSTDFMVLDVDSGLKISEAEEKCRTLSVCFLILPTVSHTEENHRFRIIFPLVKSITSISQYNATWKYLQSRFPTLDKSCSDVARFYFGCTDLDGVFCEGPFMEPQIAKEKNDHLIKEWKTVDKDYYSGKNILELFYDKIPDRIPESVDYFLREGKDHIPGNWICPLNSFVFTLSLYGISDEVIINGLEKICEQPFRKKDLDTISKALKDGAKARPDDKKDELFG